MWREIPYVPLFATLFVQALATMSAYSIPAAAPAIAADVGVDGARVGLFISIVYGVGIFSAVLSPSFVHRFGAVRVSQVILVCTIIMLLTAALGGTAGAIALSGVLLGVAYGATAPSSSHLLISRTPVRLRNLVFSIRQIGVPLGGVMGGLLVPPLVLGFDWQTALLVQLGPAILLLVLLQAMRREYDADRDVARALTRGNALAPLRLPLLAIPGNHDLREPMRAAFADAGLFPTQGRLNFVRDICGTGGDLRIVGIDTLVEGSGGGVVDAATLDFLDEALATTRPVLLAMHHPPFTSGIVFMDSIGLAGVEGLRDRLERAACQVRILCGHLHVAATGSLGRVPAIVGPSPCSAFDVDFRPDAPVGFFTGGGGFMVHDWSDGFRSLLVPPAIGAGPFPFRD